jgi:crossover junction endodeoxyribonuclease RuvC
MRILGVDPGLQATGYGVVDYDRGQYSLVEGGLIETQEAASLPERLAALYRGIDAVLRQLRPEVAVVERLYAQYRHPRTALLISHARGVVLLALAHRGLEVVSYPASLVKRALVGHGRARKDQVAGMVAQLLGVAMAGISDHVADALALALCHATPWAQATQRRTGEEGIASFLERRGRKL